jgi:hypothetical protein
MRPWLVNVDPEATDDEFDSGSQIDLYEAGRQLNGLIWKPHSLSANVLP